jgi:hypothetical protein
MNGSYFLMQWANRYYYDFIFAFSDTLENLNTYSAATLVPAILPKVMMSGYALPPRRLFP